MKKLFDRLTAVFFIAVLFIIPIVTFLPDDNKNTFSIFENRMLQSIPNFNSQTFFSGEFSNSFNKYFSDNIICRDYFLENYVYINRNILHKNVVNDIVYGNGALLAYNSTNYFDKNKISEGIKNMTKELSMLNEFISKNGGDFYYIGIPEQFSMLREYYPKYLCTQEERLNYLENNFFSSLNENCIKYINMRDIFINQNDYFDKYSHIDHHFNYLGAFDTYTNIVKIINENSYFNIKPIEKDELDFFTLKNPYLGSRNRKIYNLYENNEKVIYAYPKNKISFERYDNGKKVESNLYKIPNNTYDYVDYTVYMGGDIAETIIDTNRNELPNILLFGDSFTNPIETLLYLNFNKTFILDLRHYDKKSLYDYIEETKPDIVVCIRDDTSYIINEGNGKFR